MNTYNFTAQTDAPISTEVFAALQDKSTLIAEALTGSPTATVIMRGCELTGSIISAGIICINGELLPFESGIKNSSGQTKISIVETKRSITTPATDNHETTTYTDFVTTRKAVIDNTNGTVVWDNLARYSVVGVPSFSKKIITTSYTQQQGVSLYVKRYGSFLSIQGVATGMYGVVDTVMISLGIKSLFNDTDRIRIIDVYIGNDRYKAHVNNDGDIIVIDGFSSGSSYGSTVYFNSIIEF